MRDDVELPSCYAALWELVRELEARDFSDEELRMLFQAHLMHQCSSSNLPATVSYPAWLMADAREAWRRQVRDDVKVSRSHRELARVFDELGVRCVMDRVTDDGYFSMDIYLPDFDVAVEYDGPSHYYHENSSSNSGGASTTRTAKTELRDLFLAKRCAKVVTVPWFEFAKVQGSPEKRKMYVKEKLAKCAGVESSRFEGIIFAIRQA